MKDLNFSPVRPLINKSEHTDEDLKGCRKVKAKSTELVDFPLENNLKIRLKIHMNRNLEIGVLEVDRGHEVPLFDQPQQ